MTLLKDVMKDLDDDHAEKSRHYETVRSPFIQSMEDYYSQNTHRYKRKVRDAKWIAQEVREHIVLHVAAMLLRRKRDAERESRKLDRVTFRQFLEHPVAVRAFTRRNVFTKTVDGRVQKRSRVTGRSVRLNQMEKREVRKFRAIGRKEVKGQSA